MININKIFTYGVGFLLTLSSCNDDIIEVSNPNQPEGASDLTDPVLRAGALNAIYKPMQSQGSYGRWQYLLEDFSSDELNVTTLQNQPPIQTIIDYNLNNDSEATRLYWQSCFAGFRAANDFIGTLDNEDPSLFSEIAEARFLRGHYLFLLASRFGGLPINTSTAPQAVERLSIEDTYSFIIEDFKFASDNLPSLSEQETGRPTNESAYAYLGKAYLFSIQPDNFKLDTETYDLAFEAFSNVISYSLVDDYEDTFNAGGEYNQESLFEVDFQRQNVGATVFWSANLPNGVSDVTLRSVEYSSWGNATPSESQLNEYEEINDNGDKDPRLGFSFWMRGDTYGSSNSRVWGTDPDANRGDFGTPSAGDSCSRKYSEYIENDGSLEGSGINPRIIRYADVLLMRAEAALFKSSPDMALAISLMNQVRARPSVNMPGYPILGTFPCSNIDETFEALVHERRVELAMEGKRTVDLGRWKMDEEILSQAVPTYNTNKRFYPIPNTELLTNLNFGEDNPQ